MLKPDSNATKASVKADELLEQIIEIIRRTGLAGFSLDMLAAELGTSSRMLVYYFGSKDELLGRIVYRVREDTVTAFESQPADSIFDAIDMWWSYYRANLTDMQFFFHLATRSFEEPDKFREFSSTAVDQWTSFFYRSVRRDTRTAKEARAIARLALATVRGLTVDLLITADERRVEEALAEFKSLLRDRYGLKRSRRRS